MRRGWRRSGLAMLLALAPAVALAAAKPGWVSGFPHDPAAYVGIGRAHKREHPVHYREVAQAAALSQISREISVSLRSEESLARREDGRGWEESWSQKIQAASRNDLAGYRLVDVHETGEEYWVYYALDKEEHARLRDSRLDAHASSLESALASRALPEAMRRLPAAEAALGRLSGAGERLRAAVERIRTSARDAALDPEPGGWTFHPAAPSPGEAGIRLAEGRGGRPWKGPFSLLIRDGTGKTCRVEAESGKGLDLGKPFLACGLDPGRWNLAWVEGGFAGATAAVETRIEPRIWPLAIRCEVSDMLPWRETASAALSSLASPFLRLHFGEDCAGIPCLEIRLTAAETDSLDGLHFAALRGTLRLPDGAAYPVTGKGGHADPAKAKERAARDFASEVGKRLMP